MALVPNAEVIVKCARCRRDVDPRVCRYLFVLSGWRGRARALPSGQRPDQRRAILCGPCGDSYREAVKVWFEGGVDYRLESGVIYCGTEGT